MSTRRWAYGLRFLTADVYYFKIHSRAANGTGNYRSVYKTWLRPDPPTDHRSLKTSTTSGQLKITNGVNTGVNKLLHESGTVL